MLLSLNELFLRLASGTVPDRTVAFTIDDGLNEKGRAKQAYEEVIMRFPDHPFAKDARAMIDNLQYTDEELIERFKKMNADSATARK